MGKRLTVVRCPAVTRKADHELGPPAGTINGRLAAVRRFGYETADADSLSHELGARIGRVKGDKKLGVRSANWLTAPSGRPVRRQFDGKQPDSLIWSRRRGPEALGEAFTTGRRRRHRDVLEGRFPAASEMGHISLMWNAERVAPAG